MGNPLFLGETDFTIGFAAAIFFYSIYNFCRAMTAENGQFTMGIFKFWRAEGWG